MKGKPTNTIYMGGRPGLYEWTSRQKPSARRNNPASRPVSFSNFRAESAFGCPILRAVCEGWGFRSHFKHQQMWEGKTSNRKFTATGQNQKALNVRAKSSLRA